MKVCTVCKRTLPVERFQPMTTRDKRCVPGHTWEGYSSDCRDCRAARKREARRLAGADSREAYEARLAAEAAVRKAKRLEGYQSFLAEQGRRREERRAASEIICPGCRDTKPRAAFYPSMVVDGESGECITCREERDRTLFQRAKEELSDNYVKRQISKYSGLRHKDIPQVLVEAKRAQLALQRLVNPRRRTSP